MFRSNAHFMLGHCFLFRSFNGLKEMLASMPIFLEGWSVTIADFSESLRRKILMGKNTTQKLIESHLVEGRMEAR